MITPTAQADCWGRSLAIAKKSPTVLAAAFPFPLQTNADCVARHTSFNKAAH
jgi:hypothetical protein